MLILRLMEKIFYALAISYMVFHLWKFLSSKFVF